MMPIGIVAHDAGGAEIVSSWVKNNPSHYLFALEGPAVSIFQRKIPNLILTPLEETVKNSEYLLTGTSATSNLERNAIALSTKHKKRTISFLDHWINYKYRFTRNDVELLPDEIWVGDDLALEIARTEFPKLKITLVLNPYVKDFLLEFQEKIASNLDDQYLGWTRILFIGENISGNSILVHGISGSSDELDSLKFLIEHYSLLSETKAVLRIRPHPSELVEKYRAIAEKTLDRSLIFEFTANSLVDDLVWADVVCGMSSMALALALMVKKRVICCIPGEFSKSKLPHDKIESLSRLVIG